MEEAVVGRTLVSVLALEPRAQWPSCEKKVARFFSVAGVWAFLYDLNECVRGIERRAVVDLLRDDPPE